MPHEYTHQHLGSFRNQEVDGQIKIPSCCLCIFYSKGVCIYIFVNYFYRQQVMDNSNESNQNMEINKGNQNKEIDMDQGPRCGNAFNNYQREYF